LVDLEVGLEEAPMVGRRVLEWMQSMGIVATYPSDYTEMLAAAKTLDPPLSGAATEVMEGEHGWGPGPDYDRWVLDPDPVSTRAGLNNWFVLDIGRNVHAFPADDETPRCPLGHEGNSDIVMEAVGEWYEGTDSSVRCDACGKEWPITRWDLGEGMALGNLGLRFEGWGILSPALVAELRRLLEPDASKLISGKI
jgi:hypothetical protein